MQGNLHVPFLGGWAGAILPGYPAGASDIISLPNQLPFPLLLFHWEREPVVYK
jgi:hypothetical protein